MQSLSIYLCRRIIPVVHPLIAVVFLPQSIENKRFKWNPCDMVLSVLGY